MDILLSWSGDASHNVADFLREWLPDVLPGCVPWISTKDIQKGANWLNELHTQLSKCKVLIVCVTPDNVRSPWLYYETGLVASNLSSVAVCPYLIGVQGKLISGTPLSLYQWTEADKTDTLKLIQHLNRQLESPHDERLVDGNFQAKWPQLKRRLDKAIETQTEIEDPVETLEPPIAQQLTNEAGELLLAACRSDGEIMYLAHLGGTDIQAGQRQFVEQRDPRSLAIWEGAIDELEKFGLLASIGHKREIFRVTRAGWEVFDSLKQSSTTTPPSGAS